MALLPYFYDIDGPLRLLERDFFRREPRMDRDIFSKPLEHLSKQLKHLTVEESITADDDEKFQVSVDVQHFSPEEISVKVVDGQVIVEGKHEEKLDGHGYVSRRFMRRYPLPKRCLPDTVQSELSSDGVLSISAPKVLPLPSTGEKIVPIIQTGPIKKQLHPQELQLI